MTIRLPSPFLEGEEGRGPDAKPANNSNRCRSWPPTARACGTLSAANQQPTTSRCRRRPWVADPGAAPPPAAVGHSKTSAAETKALAVTANISEPAGGPLPPRVGAWAAALAGPMPCGHDRARMAVGVDPQGLWWRRCLVCKATPGGAR